MCRLNVLEVPLNLDIFFESLRSLKEIGGISKRDRGISQRDRDNTMELKFWCTSCEDVHPLSKCNHDETKICYETMKFELNNKIVNQYFVDQLIDEQVNYCSHYLDFINVDLNRDYSDRERRKIYTRAFGRLKYRCYKCYFATHDIDIMCMHFAQHKPKKFEAWRY